MAERVVGHHVGVELAAPVDQAIAAGIGNEHVAPGAAVGEVLPRRVGVGPVVQPAGGRQLVVDVDQVVAPAGPDRVAAGAADHPVVAEIAEDDVVAVGGHRRIRSPDDPVSVERAFGLVEVERPLEARPGLRQRPGRRQQDLAQRVVRVVQRELRRGRVVAEHVARIDRMRVVASDRPADPGAGLVVVGDVRERRRLGARDRVFAGAAVEGVVAQSAVDDVIGVERARHQGCRRGIARIHAVRRQIDRVLERPVDVGDRYVAAARILDERVDLRRRDRGDAVQRLAERRAVAAGEDAPVVAQNSRRRRCRRRSSRARSRRRWSSSWPSPNRTSLPTCA